MGLLSGAMSTPFRVDLDDLRFVLFEQLRIDETLQRVDRYKELDRDLYDATLEEGAKIAKEVLHPVNRPGDLEGCTLDGDGNVTTPKGYKDAWRRMAEGGWIAPTAPPELGGGGLPAVMAMALNDMFIGAATAFMMYPGLTAAAGRMAQAHAPEALRALVAGKLFAGQWAGTMCLTEAGAGSSVGDNRAKATPTDEPGVYELEGEKIFISGGDHDLAENIIHFVLARTPGAPAGTKGLSLFLVPKFMFDEKTGALGERNGAKVVGIEHKMGIHGSSTCVLALGSDRPCKGWIVGEECEGIRLMFQMMNEARIGVAAQGESMAAAAYGYAVQYAAERVQGTDIREYKNPEAPRVTIDRHPDVRRMLMTLKVHAETMRAAMLRLAMNFDMSEQLDDEADRKRLFGRVELLTPVLKSHCTDTGFEMAVTAVQVYGGYGYIAEFPVEQLVRDAKIQSIYEGTNGIQAMDLLGRKMRMEGGALFMGWMQEGQKLVAEAKAAGLAAADAVGKAIGQLGAAAMHLSKLAAGGKIAEAFYMAVPFQSAFGIVVCALEALDQARIAKAKIDAGDERPLLRGKLRNLEFYTAHVLPKAVAFAKTVQSADASALDESLFP